jgi:DNA polymerase III subunit epsilon
MDLGEAERLIEANQDYRLLRRVPGAKDWRLAPAGGETRRAVLVDTETTGLDPDVDEVIELALLAFEYERESGLIVSVDATQSLSAFREPASPIPPEASKIHGISNEMVKGQSIDIERVKAII